MSILLKHLSFYVAIAGLLVAGQLVWRLSEQAPTPEPPHAPVINPYGKALAASGLVEALGDNIELGAPVAGLVVAVLVDVWDLVEAGQPLLQLDDRDLRAALHAQRAAVTVAEATLARLEGQLERLESVADQRAIPREELETKRSDVRVAEAQLQSAHATVEQTQQLIDRLVVRSPSAATILQVNVRPGEYVIPGGPPPLLIGDLSRLQVRADLDEQLAPRVRPGMRATGYLKGNANRALDLTFLRIEPFVVPKQSLTGSSSERVDTRVLQVIFHFARPSDLDLYVGQQIDLYLEE